MLLVERRPGQAELGVVPPHVAGKAVRLFHERLAGLEIVAVGQQTLDAVLEQPLLLAQPEVHLHPPVQREGRARSARGGIVAAPTGLAEGSPPPASPLKGEVKTALRLITPLTTPVSPWR